MATGGDGDGINGTLAIGNEPQPTVYLLRREQPQVQLTWASKFPSKPDKLKLRKEISVFPIKLTLKADYDTSSKEFDYGCSAKVRSLSSFEKNALMNEDFIIFQSSAAPAAHKLIFNRRT